jgi:hypothetical protein
MELLGEDGRATTTVQLIAAIAATQGGATF